MVRGAGTTEWPLMRGRFLLRTRSPAGCQWHVCRRHTQTHRRVQTHRPPYIDTQGKRLPTQTPRVQRGQCTGQSRTACQADMEGKVKGYILMPLGCTSPCQHGLCRQRTGLQQRHTTCNHEVRHVMSSMHTSCPSGTPVVSTRRPCATTGGGQFKMWVGHSAYLPISSWTGRPPVTG